MLLWLYVNAARNRPELLTCLHCTPWRGARSLASNSEDSWFEYRQEKVCHDSRNPHPTTEISEQDLKTGHDHFLHRRF